MKKKNSSYEPKSRRKNTQLGTNGFEWVQFLEGEKKEEEIIPLKFEWIKMYKD